MTSKDDQFKYMTTKMKGWERMWALMAAIYGDRLCLNRISNEKWQYLSSFQRDDIWWHSFRHRDLPNGDGTYAYENIAAQEDDWDYLGSFENRLSK
jgi:hypothetical protein